MTVHAHSITAWRTLDIGMRQAAVLDVYKTAFGESLTDRDVAQRLGLTDMNGCRPRITELLRIGKLRAIGKCTCPVTGHKVRRCELAP